MRLPLCIDLDGTLILSDTLIESLLLLLKQKPWLVLLLPFWLCSGKARFKARLASYTTLNPNALPYHPDLLDYLTSESQKGRKVYLVTAANQAIADSIARHLNVFKQAFGSDDKRNLKGRHKRDFLNDQFGKGKYDYAGNHHCDLPIFKDAGHSIVVNASTRTHTKAEALGNVSHTFPAPKLTIKAFLKAIRIHQYVKNILLFIPLLLAHTLLNIPLLTASAWGFISFCLLASGTYLLNDLLDLEADRLHKTKCRRPLASGVMPLPLGLILCPTLIVAALIIAMCLSKTFLIVLLTYFMLTLTYSFYLKRKALLDVFALSLLYTLRILAGMALLQMGYSNWLIIFSLFFFTSLAFVKRYTELSDLSNSERKALYGRGYHVDNLQMIATFGVCAGFLSVLVFTFYLNSVRAVAMYTHPQFLYLICPTLLYWLSRIWLKASQNEMHEDPIVFAIKDKTSYCILIAIIIISIISAL
jgi:4-hydroxybenzoate polyprenyltransferase